MKTSLATLDGLKRALTVELPVETFSQKTDKILQKMALKVAINGFRKGKVPLSVLRQQFGKDANMDATNEIANETLADALMQVKATPAGHPVITKTDTKDENSFSYTVEFEVYPDIKVADFSKLKIQQASVKITTADEENAFSDLIQQSTEYKAVKRKAQSGDQLTIDFKGTIDGKIFAGGEAQDFKLILGKGSMIAGFEEGLVGMEAEQTTNLDLTFPQDYQVTQLAAKEVNFAITVKQVASPQELKLDVNFAKKFGDKDIDSLKKNIKTQMRVEADNRIANQNKDAIFAALLAANDFKVPQSSIDHETQNLAQEMQQRMQQQGIPASSGNLPASTFDAEAQRRVKLGLLVAQIAQDNKFEASNQQIDEKLKEMAQLYGKNAQQMIEYYNKDASRRSSIELLVVEKMVQDAILAKAEVTTISKKFTEVTHNKSAVNNKHNPY